jgi:putative ABC transport system substrate-binding protein
MGRHGDSVMHRRTFIGAAAVTLIATPFGIAAQQELARIPRIGFLGATSAADSASRVDALRAGLRNLGYVEGKNIVIEFRWAEGDSDRLAVLAGELVRSGVDVIVTTGASGALAARSVTTTIPIVLGAAGDPVGVGLVASLARPGGNVTGLTIVAPEVTGKRLELLRVAVPRLTRVAALWNAGAAVSASELLEAEAAARALGMQLISVEVRDMDRLDSAFLAIVRERAQAVIVLSDVLFFGRRNQIAELAVMYRLPSIAWARELAVSGCLMVYGVNGVELHRRAAYYVDKILKGAKPGDLSIEQPTKFELIINLKTAKALGLTIPQALLLRADEVIN